MLLVNTVLIVLFIFSLLPVSLSQGLCKKDLSLTSCCSDGSCCVPASNGFPACCCDENCFKYGDCCLDAVDIGCSNPPGTPHQPLPDFCSIYSSLYTCTSVGVTDGCCVGSNCTVSSPSGTCCSCDKDCHISSRQDCCSDINTIGCSCNNTCTAHYFSGCCTGGRGNCHTTCPDYCYCDEQCHNRGDCCPDIEDIGCRSPLTMPPPTQSMMCPQQSLNGTTWPSTNIDTIVYVSCATGETGNYTRYCKADGTWNNIIINSCKSISLNDNEREIVGVINGNSSVNANDLIENITRIAIMVSSDEQTPAFPENLAAINRLISNSLDILLTTDSENETNIIQPYGLLTVLDNILDTRYEGTWKTLNNDVGSQLLMENIEKLGRYTGQVVVLNQTEDDRRYDELRRNINVQVDVVNEETVDYMFASTRSTNINQDGFIHLDIPEQRVDLQDKRQVAVVNSIVKNIADFIIATTGRSDEIEPGTNVISTQIVSATQSYSLRLMLNFTTKIFTKNVTNPRCVFWNFTAGPDGTGDWSEEGIDTIMVSEVVGPDGEPDQFNIVCNSSHMTPFVVLVDAHDVIDKISPGEAQGLRILSYIGMTLSCCCIVLSLVFLLMLKKELIKSVQFFVHFNLCLALLFGYVIFIFFIDDSLFAITYSKIGCAFVAGLLQYFFLAAFSWMLCEGIMLFLLLVVVFSTISKRWYVFLIIGWGLPVFPVAISAGVIHDAYGVQGRFCWLDPNKRGATWAFLGPMILIILVNVVFLIMSLRALIVYHSTSMKNKGKDKVGLTVFKKSILGTITLLPILGITWLIALFSVNSYSSVFAWLFVIFASLQGVLIFAMNIIRNDKIRETIRKRFHLIKKKIETSTYGPSSKKSGKPKLQTRSSSFYLTSDKSTAGNPSFAPSYPTLDRKKILADMRKNRGSAYIESVVDDD